MNAHYLKVLSEGLAIDVDRDAHDAIVEVVANTGCSYASTSEPAHGLRRLYLSENAVTALSASGLLQDLVGLPGPVNGMTLAPGRPPAPRAPLTDPTAPQLADAADALCEWEEARRHSGAERPSETDGVLAVIAAVRSR